LNLHGIESYSTRERIVLAVLVNMLYFLNMVRENSSARSEHSPRVQRKRLEKQEFIVDTAMGLLAEGGLEMVTVGRLAKELDYTPGALYRYFPSMEALLAQMQKRAIASLHERIMRAIAPFAGNGQEIARLRAVAACYLEGTSGEAAHEHQLSLISQMLASPKVLIGDPIATQTAPKLIALLMLVEQLISQAQETGSLSAGLARERAVQLWAGLQGAVALGKLSRFDSELFSAQHVGQGLLENLLIAWGAPQCVEKG
jgi:AcrR family transcriptional regulator